MGQPITVWSTAYDQKRPYLDLFDASRSIEFIIRNNLFDGRIYNILTENATVHQVVDIIREFIPDTYNYDISKDSGIIRSIDNPINFSSEEYINLGEKVKIKEEQLIEADLKKKANNNVKVKDANEESKDKINEAL